jgi:hypothetical protein
MLGYNPRRDPRDQTNRYNMGEHFGVTSVQQKIIRLRKEDSKNVFFRPGGFLYTWDGGNQLSYPVKYHDIGKHQRHSHQSGTIRQLIQTEE